MYGKISFNYSDIHGSFINCLLPGEGRNQFKFWIEEQPTISTNVKSLNCPNKHFPMFIFSLNHLN